MESVYYNTELLLTNQAKSTKIDLSIMKGCFILFFLGYTLIYINILTGTAI